MRESDRQDNDPPPAPKNGREYWTGLGAPQQPTKTPASLSERLGHKVTAGKLRWSCVPPKAMRHVVECLTKGAELHKEALGEQNWRNVPNAEQEYFNAHDRHISALRCGEKRDDGPDGSGCHHLAAAIVDALFLLELALERGE